VKPRGARDYRGAIAGFDDVEIAYLSAAEITTQLSQGAAHLGIRPDTIRAAKARARTFGFDFPATSLGPSFW
jgi:ATP phosphoribosyltransferase